MNKKLPNTKHEQARSHCAKIYRPVRRLQNLKLDDKALASRSQSLVPKLCIDLASASKKQLTVSQQSS